MNINLCINGRNFPFHINLKFVHKTPESPISTIAFLRHRRERSVNFFLSGHPSKYWQSHNNARLGPKLEELGYEGVQALEFINQVAEFAESGVSIDLSTFENRSCSRLIFNIQALIPLISEKTGNLVLITSKKVPVSNEMKHGVATLLESPDTCNPADLITTLKAFGFKTDDSNPIGQLR